MTANKILNSLYKVTKQVIKGLTLKERTEAVAKLCVEELNLKLCWIGKKQKDGSVSVFVQYPPEHPYPGKIKVRWDESEYGSGPTGKAIRFKTYQVLQDIESPQYKLWLSTAKKYGFKSSASFPIIADGEVFGALNLYANKKNFFNSKIIEAFVSFSEIIGIAFRNALFFEQSIDRLNKITALRNIDLSIISSFDIRVIYDVFINAAVNLLNIDAVSILVFDEATQELYFKVQRGLLNDEFKKQRIKIGQFIPGKAARERKILKVSQQEMDEPLRKMLMQMQGFEDYYVCPMISKGRLLGVVEFFQRKKLNHDEEWFNFLETLTGQISIAVENANILSEIQSAKEDLLLAYDQTIEALSFALDLRDKETEGHSQRVTELTVKIAEKFRIKGEKLRYVRWGALLHDIGKLGIPDNILLKPGPLSSGEWEIMKKHPEYGYNMLSRVEYLLPALEIPLYHHEKWDGSGYPRGLKGKVPLSARIFAVVDVWDALTNERPYRPAWSKERALQYIVSQSGIHFDPEVVKIFLEIMQNKI